MPLLTSFYSTLPHFIVTSFQEADRIFEESQFTKVVFQNQEYDRSKAFDQQPIPGETNCEDLKLVNVPSMFKWKQRI